MTFDHMGALMNQGDISWTGRTQRFAPLLALLVLQACPCYDCPHPSGTSGTVIGVGAVQGATVCVDANRNGACDAGEPISAATDAQGHYSITGSMSGQPPSTMSSDVGHGGKPTEQAESEPAPTPPLVAIVPATAVDAGNPGTTVGRAYTLRAPEGWGGVISPMTTLVQAGVAQGLTRYESEAAIGAQLQIAIGSAYSDYTMSSERDNGTLRALAPAIIAGLHSGAPMAVAAATTQPADYHVRALTYTDANNYTLRYFYSVNAPDTAGLYTFYDLRTGRAAGSPVAQSTLYSTVLQATATGWAPVTSASAHTISGGSPSVLSYASGAYTYVATRAVVDVAGQPMADVVRQAQDMAANTFSTLAGVNAAALTGTMPAGAKVLKITTVGMATPVAYREADGSVAAPVATLAAMVAAYATPAAPTPANTLPMGVLHGSAGCGSATFCPQEALRIAFGAGNSAAFYLCDLSPGTNVQSNCTAAGTSTYTLGKAADKATPIMSFAGLPAAASIQTFTRVFVERNGHVYFGTQDKPATSTQTRLNRVAFEALAPALGIVPPTFSSSVSAFAGTWTAAYTGGDTGSCPTGSIDVLGHLAGSCSSTVTGQSFIVSGTVNPTGAADFTSSGGSSSGARFTGTLSGSSGAGTWALPIPLTSGTWTATKVP